MAVAVAVAPRRAEHEPDTWAGPAEADASRPPPSDALWQRSRLLWLGQAIGVLVLSFALWAGCLHLYQLHNDFPASYHPDELSKAAQLRDNDRNFNHPQLMLEAAQWVIPPVTGASNLEEVVKQSRIVSAGFGAGTAVLLAWAGWAAAGWAGFLALGLAVGLCPALLSHAHFFKEDPALMFGIACTLCAGAWAMRVKRPGPLVWCTLALGVGAGVSASGKYCGAVMLIPAVVAAIVATRRYFGLLLATPLMVIVFAVAACAAINYRAFDDFQRFLQTIDREEEHSTTEHRGVTMDRPNAFFSDAVWKEAMPHVKALAVLTVPLLLWQAWRRRRWAFGAWLIVTGGLYATMLAYSVIPFYRYALPVTVMLYALAGLAAAWLTTLPPKPWMRRAALGGVLAIIGITQGLRCADYSWQFANDSHVALHDWINTTLPPGTPVAADHYAVMLERDGYADPHQTTHANVITQLGGNSNITLDELRRRGVQYVITVGTDSERYLSPHVRGTDGFEEGFKRIADFYSSVRSLPVAWSQVAAHPMLTFANPDIVVYRLNAAK